MSQAQSSERHNEHEKLQHGEVMQVFGENPEHRHRSQIKAKNAGGHAGIPWRTAIQMIGKKNR